VPRQRAGAGPDWRIQIPVYRTPRLVVADDLVLVTGGDGSTFAVNLSAGNLRWRTVPPVPSTAYSLDITPTRGTVLTATTTYDDPPRHLVYATDAADGRLRWSRTALGVVVADQSVTVLRTARSWQAVGTLDGTPRWSRPAPGIGSAGDVPTGVLTRHTVVLPQQQGAALGLDRQSGRVRWRGPTTSSEPVRVGTSVVMSTADGRVVALDGRTGAHLWSRVSLHALLELAAGPGHGVLVLDSDLVPHSTD
jgi:outer membrane protein assembly factor BamB